MKKLILFAQTSEAAATINALKAMPIPNTLKTIWSEGEVATQYEYDNGWIIITDIGVHGAQHAVSALRFPFEEVWNLGLAGSLRSHLDIGTILEIGNISKFTPLTRTQDSQTQAFLNFVLPQMKITQHPVSLITADFPIHDDRLRTSLSENWDLVDMEGYGIAFAAQQLGKKCRMWKVVSDFASPGGRELIRKNKAALSELLAKRIIEEGP